MCNNTVTLELPKGYAGYPPGQVVPQGAYPPPSPAAVAVVSAVTSPGFKRAQSWGCGAIMCLVGVILLGLGGSNPWKVTANPEEDFKKIQAGCQYTDFVLTSVDKQVVRDHACSLYITFYYLLYITLYYFLNL